MDLQNGYTYRRTSYVIKSKIEDVANSYIYLKGNLDIDIKWNQPNHIAN